MILLERDDASHGAYYGLINHYHYTANLFIGKQMKMEMRRMIDRIIGEPQYD